MTTKTENLIKGTDRIKLTRSLKKSATSVDSRLHVLPSRGIWGIKYDGKIRLTKTFPSKSLAISSAKQLALSEKIQWIVVHDKYGRVRASIKLN